MSICRESESRRDVVKLAVRGLIAQGLSVREVAEQAGMSYTHLTEVLAGKRKFGGNMMRKVEELLVSYRAVR